MNCDILLNKHDISTYIKKYDLLFSHILEKNIIFIIY